MTRTLRLLIVALLACALLTGCFGRKKKPLPDLNASSEPDKVLYDRALEDIRRGRHTVGRLTLQTVINTYPDSEYLAKAKLAIADSYYKEGGTSGLTQAVAEYKDFITFFPFLDEAAYAQMQVGMAHYRRMEKPDRDRIGARLAEEELQVFLQKYPQHPLAPEAEQRLREVQEVLADGEFRIARFYYIKGSLRAAGARLLDLTNRYPLYSQADESLWMLANVFERSERDDIAGQYYSRIVREYPVSNLVADAKKKLTKLDVPIPQPDPAALARMQHEREVVRDRAGLLKRPLGVFRSGPDVSMAAKTGQPTLTPVTESATETISPGGNLAMRSETVSGASSAPASHASEAPGSGNSASPDKTDRETLRRRDTASRPLEKDASDKAKPEEEKPAAEKKKDSQNKKKKGLRKFLPW